MSPLTALLLGACTSDSGWQGATGVGNPGSSKQQLARTDLDITRATVHTDALVIDRCDEPAVTVEVGAEVDLRDDVPLQVPGGLWCGLRVQWFGPLRIDESGALAVELDLAAADLVAPLPVLVDADALVFELAWPGWLDASDLDLTAELVDRVELGSALYADTDADGALSDAERIVGPVFAGPLHPRSTDDEDDD